MDTAPRVPHTIERAGQLAVELGLLAYLAQFPLSTALPAAVQATALFIALLGVLSLQIGALSRGVEPPHVPLLIPTLLFFASFAIAIGLSDQRALSASRATFLPVALLVFFAAQAAFHSLDALRRLGWVFVLVLGAIGVNGVYQSIHGVALFSNQGLYADRVRGGLPHPNDLALVPLFLPLAAWTLAGDSARWRQGLGALAIGLGVATAALSGSRNALIGLGVVLATSLLLSRQRRAWLGLSVLTVGCGVGLSLLAPDSAAHRLLDPELFQREGRIGLWLSALEIFKESPVTGSGPFLFDRLYAPYVEQAALPEGYQPERGYVPWVHNLYLEALAERGVIGLATFALLIVASLRQLTKRWRATTSPSTRGAIGALATAWAALLVMGLLDLTFLKDWVLVVFALWVGLAAQTPTPIGSTMAAPAERYPRLREHEQGGEGT